jgi:hypothetical protein
MLAVNVTAIGAVRFFVNGRFSVPLDLGLTKDKCDVEQISVEPFAELPEVPIVRTQEIEAANMRSTKQRNFPCHAGRELQRTLALGPIANGWTFPASTAVQSSEKASSIALPSATS